MTTDLAKESNLQKIRLIFHKFETLKDLKLRCLIPLFTFRRLFLYKMFSILGISSNMKETKLDENYELGAKSWTLMEIPTP